MEATLSALFDRPNLHDVRPDIIQLVQRSMAASTDRKIDGSGNSQDFSHGSVIPESRPAFTAIRPDEFAEVEIMKPPEETSDKMLSLLTTFHPLILTQKWAT